MPYAEAALPSLPVETAQAGSSRQSTALVRGSPGLPLAPHPAQPALTVIRCSSTVLLIRH